MGRKRDAHPKAQIIKEQKEAARLLDVTDRQLRNWRREDDFPDCSSGYDLAAIREWRDRHERTGSAERDAASKLQTALKREKLEQEQIKTEEARLRLAEKQGTLIDRATVELAIAEILTKHGEWCTQLPDILRGKCCKQCRERVPPSLAAELDTRRNDLANALANLRSSS